MVAAVNLEGRAVSKATTSGETPDLAILLEAMAAVVGTVSKVYQAVKRAVDSASKADYGRALEAFDGLPAWQKARILKVAVTRAAELSAPGTLLARAPSADAGQALR
jgi:hypothetical protein